MAQWLEAFAALAEDLGYILSIQMLHICNSSFKELDALFWLPRVPSLYMVLIYTYMQANPHFK